MLVAAFFLLFQSFALAGGYLIDSWDTEKGLPDNYVTSMVQTPDGYLWIGTYNGVARFDGSRFVVFKPQNTPQIGHQRIVKLFLDAQGTLWINAYDGSLTSYRNGVFTSEWRGKGRNISEAWLVASDAHEIIFSFRSGLLIRRAVNDPATGWQVFNPPGNPPGAFYCQDGTGGLWCSTMNGQLWRLVSGNYELVPLADSLRGQEIHWLAPDLTGRIWVGTEKEIASWNGRRFENRSPGNGSDLNVAFFSFLPDGGVLTGANGELRKLMNGQWDAQYPAWPDLMQEQELQSSLFHDHAGGWWRVSRGLGIFHFDPRGGSEQITAAAGLPGDHVTCWLEDREGNYWVGLGNGGIARLRKKYFETLPLPGPSPRPVISVCEDSAGALWLGTYGGGLDRWQYGTMTNFPVQTENPGSFTFSICSDVGQKLWISAGLEDLFNFKNEELKKSPVAVHAVKTIFLDRQKRLWLGRKDGVDCWVDGKLHEWNSHNGSVARPVRTIAQDKQDVVWFGSDDENIYRADKDTLVPLHLPAFPARQAVWALLADEDGSLWIGTSDAGLLHYQSAHFTRFTARDGLVDDLICQILDDGRGNLWLGSHRGICRVSKAVLHQFAAGMTSVINCSIYDRSDGLPSLQCSEMYQPSAWRAHDGRLWFGTARGVVGVQPADMPFNLSPPPVVVEEFLADGKIQAPMPGKNGGADNFKISPGRQNFEFRYTALSLTSSEKNRFRYKLEGFDAGWIDAGPRRWVQYNYLKPGKYRFCVAACNNDGIWNEAGGLISLEILPHFWETWWFRLSLALALVAAVAVIARQISRRELGREMARLQHQRDLEKDRARIARDIHDHIGSGLTRINLLNELLLGEPPEYLPQYIGQVTGVTCELMQTMDEIVWAVNPKNDSLESLMTYVCDFAEDYLRAAKIRLRLNVPALLPDWHLASELRHNLFLAVKEILNNIVKHAHADEVCLNLRLAENAAILEVRDNGRGLTLVAGKHRTGNGLENLKKRAEAFGGSCQITSEPGAGVKIELTFPRPQERSLLRA